jgi:hypothetical protein
MHDCSLPRKQRCAATRVWTTDFAVKTSMASACSTFQCHIITRHELATAVYNMTTDAGSMVSLALTVVPYHLSLQTVATIRGHGSRGFETVTSTDVYTSSSTCHCMIMMRCGVERTGCESISTTSISCFPSVSSLDKRGIKGKQRLRKGRLFDWMWWWWWWRCSW